MKVIVDRIFKSSALESPLIALYISEYDQDHVSRSRPHARNKTNLITPLSIIQPSFTSYISYKKRQFLIPVQRCVQVMVAHHVDVVISRIVFIPDENIILDLQSVLQFIPQLIKSDGTWYSDSN